MLIAATITTGLVAGLFYGFVCAVMPGLRRVDDATLIAVMQSINRRIVNVWFLACFLAAPVLTVIAGVVEFSGGGDRLLPIAIAVALTVVSYLTTAAVNIPLNNALDAAGDPARIADTRSVRRRFEGRWVGANAVRTLASTASFGCLVWALAISPA